MRAGFDIYNEEELDAVRRRPEKKKGKKPPEKKSKKPPEKKSKKPPEKKSKKPPEKKKERLPPPLPRDDEVRVLEREVENAEKLVSKAKARAKITARRARDLEQELEYAESEEEREILKNDLEEAQKKRERAALAVDRAESSLIDAKNRLEEARFAAERAEEPEAEEPAPAEEEEPELEKPVEDEVYEVEAEPEEEPELPKPRRKFRWTPLKVITAVIVLFIVLPVVCYGFVIPRAEAVVRVMYYEGFQGSIVIDAEVKNTGTVDLSDVNITITVLDADDIMVAQLSYDDPLVYPRTDSRADAVKFAGNQRIDYSILVEVECYAEGSSLSDSNTYYVDGPYMTYVFEDKIDKWIP